MSSKENQLELLWHQRADVDAIKKAKLRVLLANAPGCGKTAVAIRALAETWNLSLPALFLCPSSVTGNWAKEIGMWASGIRAVIIDDMATNIPTYQEPTIYIMGWALLDSRHEEIIGLGIKSIVGDEFHYVRNDEALRTKALVKVLENVPHRMGLTGTPIVNTAEEMDTIKQFIGPNPLMIRRVLEDVAPQVPPKTRNYLKIRLRPRHQAIYDKAQQEFEDWLRSESDSLRGQGKTEEEIERIMKVEGLVKIGYLRRLVGEFKVPAALDWIARAIRLGEPVVVFVEHQVPLLKLQKGLRKLNIKYTTIEGATTSLAREEAKVVFQAGEVPVFIGTKAAKEGITLHAARNLIFIERFFTAADEEQAEDRIRRLGQTSPTTMWYLHVENTVDDRIDAVVRNKRAIVREVLGSVDIVETSDENIKQLLSSWDKVVAPPSGSNVIELGEGEPLPPLPSRKMIQCIVFKGGRWNERTALQWCAMNKYSLGKETTVEVLPGRVKVHLAHATQFAPGSITKVEVSAEINIIRGEKDKRKSRR